MRLSLQSENGGPARIKVAGAINQNGVRSISRPFNGLLGEAPFSQRVVLDLSDSEYLDSSGVSWLLGTHEHFEESGGRLVLHSVSPMAMNVLKVLGMHRLFHVAGSERDAIQMVENDES